MFHLEIPDHVYQKNIQIPHPYNIIIYPNVIIGHNVTIYHCVTLGKVFGRSKKAGTPRVGDNCVIFPHSLIVGNITLCKNSVILGGSIVVNDVPEGVTVGGNPARILGVN